MQQVKAGSQLQNFTLIKLQKQVGAALDHT